MMERDSIPLSVRGTGGGGSGSGGGGGSGADAEAKLVEAVSSLHLAESKDAGSFNTSGAKAAEKTVGWDRGDKGEDAEGEGNDEEDGDEEDFDDEDVDMGEGDESLER